LAGAGFLAAGFFATAAGFLAMAAGFVAGAAAFVAGAAWPRAARTAASTSSACPFTDTFGQCASTRPSSPISTVERMMPSIGLPYRTFSPHAPYAVSTAPSASLRSGKFRPNLSRNLQCDAIESLLTPKMRAPSLAKAGPASRKASASIVQPGVLSRG
jgi:hypothetical protein